MASEIRVNKINNRAGLGTVEYTPTGIIVSGIVTAYEFDGNFDTTPGIVITGIGTAQSLDVDDFVDVGSNIKLGNAGVVTATTFSTANVDVTTDKIVVGTGVTIEANQVATGQATFTGIVTASSFRGDGSQLTGISVGGSSGIDFNDNVKIRMGTGNDFEIYHDNASRSGIRFTNPEFRIMAAHATTGNIQFGVSNSSTELSYSSLMAEFKKGAECYLTYNSSQKIATSNTGISVYGTVVARASDIDDFISVGNNIHLGNAGVVTATSFSGDGSALSNLPAGAPVGGASTNTVFFENDVAVAVNYQITTNKNAMSAGPIAINAGIAVTVPSGCSWTIV